MKTKKQQPILTYKGFDKDLKCRDFQYEIGKEYVTDTAVACESGFHACENPMDVFNYYPPADSRYCTVEQSGEISNRGGDSKVASTKIKLNFEIGLPGLIKAGVEYILSNVDFTNNKESNTGNYSAATNTGYRSASEVSGKESIAVVTGYDSKAKGSIGCWIVLTERDDNMKIIHVQAYEVDGENVKADTYYKLSNKQIVEA